MFNNSDIFRQNIPISFCFALPDVKTAPIYSGLYLFWYSEGETPTYFLKVLLKYVMSR